nr:ABC transporter G family member 17-like [Tanacetum cinerariifolium]
MRHNYKGTRPDMVIDIGKPMNFTGGLEFMNLAYTVMKKKKSDEGKWEKQEADLLNKITGYAPKGCITAVMGPSGAGKSTFLDGLAGRIASGSLKGRVSLDGNDMSPSLIKRTSAYIMQDDRLFPMLTVYETLMFAADFRLGSISRAEKRQRVETLIEQLGLSVRIETYILENMHIPELTNYLFNCRQQGTRTLVMKGCEGFQGVNVVGYRSV